MSLLNKYQSAVITTDSQLAENEVSVSLSSTKYPAVLQVFPNKYYIAIKPNSVEIHPTMSWVPSTEIQVTLPSGTHKYTTQDDFYFYAPEHVMYAKGELNSSTLWESLKKEGLATPLEEQLLANLPENLKAFGHKLSKCLVGSFTYNNTVEDVAVTLLKGFRRAQQLVILLGLDSLVELILATPSANPSWFRKAELPFCLEDEEVIVRFSKLEDEVVKLHSALVRSKANVGYIDALSTQLPPSSKMYPLLEALILYFLALRYHQNGEFSY